MCPMLLFFLICSFLMPLYVQDLCNVFSIEKFHHTCWSMWIYIFLNLLLLVLLCLEIFLWRAVHCTFK